MNASDYLERAVLNQFFKSTTQPTPAAVFLALYISNPTDADTGTEVSAAGYNRQQITFGEVTQASGKGQTSNTNKIDFPIAEIAWGTVAYFGIRDAANGGNLLAWGPWSQSKDIGIGDQFVVQIGDLALNMD
jgi:hypothetical protein